LKLFLTLATVPIFVSSVTNKEKNDNNKKGTTLNDDITIYVSVINE
jgi:hypothetical protein